MNLYFRKNGAPSGIHINGVVAMKGGSLWCNEPIMRLVGISDTGAPAEYFLKPDVVTEGVTPKRYGYFKPVPHGFYRTSHGIFFFNGYIHTCQKSNKQSIFGTVTRGSLRRGRVTRRRLAVPRT